MTFSQMIKNSSARVGIFVLAAVLVCHAQGLSAQKFERITLKSKQLRVYELFREIERQTGSVVVVRSGAIDNTRVIDLPSESLSMREALDSALAGSDHGWSTSENYIIIGPKQVPPTSKTQPKPIIIERRELRQLALEERRAPDSVAYIDIDRDPVGFTAADKTFATPGKINPAGRVIAPLNTAPRNERSKFVIKTNLLYGIGAFAPNLRGEVALGNRITLEGGFSYNGWNLKGKRNNNRKMVHGAGIVEGRYWLCERFNGHYFGLHGFGGFYNVSGHRIPSLVRSNNLLDRQYRYQGYMHGVGVSYGYMLPLAPRWALEFNVGVGAAWLHYDKYGCAKCGELVEKNIRRVYLGPTRAGINLVFTIK